MRVGFVGLGLMGAPMAAGVLSSGFPVSAYDTNQEAVEELARRGAVPARSPAEAAERVVSVPAFELVVSGIAEKFACATDGRCHCTLRLNRFAISVGLITTPENTYAAG